MFLGRLHSHAPAQVGGPRRYRIACVRCTYVATGTREDGVLGAMIAHLRRCHEGRDNRREWIDVRTGRLVRE